MTPALIDSHAHLVPSVYGDEMDAVLERARAAGVRAIVCIGAGYGQKSARDAIQVAEEREGVVAVVGMHPHDAQHLGADELSELEEMARHPKVVAWGEIGLDFHYDNSPREQQEEAFRVQLRSASQLGLPVVLHSRSADADTLRILDQEQAFDGKVLVHCFSHGPDFAREMLDRGAMLSIPGIVTFRGAHELREALELVPLDRLLVETDSPFLAPAPNRGKRNEPALVREVAQAVAELKGMSLDELAPVLWDNTDRFFALSERGLLPRD